MIGKVALTLGIVIFELVHKLEKVHELREIFEDANHDEYQTTKGKLEFSVKE